VSDETMARTVKAPDVRRTEILDAAQQFFYAKGYEQTSVQEIIDQVGIAKGTFYHYFASKVELLDELIERMADQSMTIVEPIAMDDTLDAATKFRQLFSVIASWKTQSKAFLLDILRPYYADDNAVLRHKTQTAAVARIAPHLTRIIRQGRLEGAFAVDDADEVASIVMLILTSLSEGLALMILQETPNGDALAAAERKVIVAQHAIERLLGAAAGSLPIMQLASLRPWFA
jgi:AcrR family transcriptional regulator